MVELITPATAQALLDNLGLHEGSFEPLRVDWFLGKMRAGTWELRGPAVRVVNGKLTNGRHRLTALVRYGAALPFIVFRKGDDNGA